MVSNTVLISMAFTLLVSLVLPIVILLFLMKGRKGVFSVWVAGALGFVVPQLFIRIPALQYLGKPPVSRHSRSPGRSCMRFFWP